MRKFKNIILVLVSVNLFILTGCEKNNTDVIQNIDFDYLKGTWVDKESLGLQFIDFYSESQAKFGVYGKNFEQYEPFNYQIIESGQLTINFGGNALNKTFHNLSKKGNDTIAISDLTDIPENPNKIYLRREIITKKQNDTIIIGHNQIYFDFENYFKLQIDSIVEDSRCPTGVVCAWEGNAKVQFSLIIGGNYQYNFPLNTHHGSKTDTLIGNIKYKLVGLTPQPKSNKAIDLKDYTAKLIAEKQ